jgi:hypothetical protein
VLGNDKLPDMSFVDNFLVYENNIYRNGKIITNASYVTSTEAIPTNPNKGKPFIAYHPPREVWGYATFDYFNLVFPDEQIKVAKSPIPPTGG